MTKHHCNCCGKGMMITQHAKTGICWECYNNKKYGKIIPNDDGSFGKEKTSEK